MKIIEIIDKFILEPEKENKKPNLEGLAFFMKMKADFFRYICETAEDMRLNEVKTLSKKTYLAANEIQLPPLSPTKLSIILNMCVFEAEVNKNFTFAIKTSEKLLGDAIEKLEELKDDSLKEVNQILDTVKENMILWKDEQENSKNKD